MHFFRLIVKPESDELADDAADMLRAEALPHDLAASRSMLSPA